MQKILVVLSVLYGGFCGISYATTVNYNWLVDGTNYAQTTCETGDDLILPTPAPTKYGYHFVGWVESEIFGSWSRSGTPTPQNPIEPVFKPFLNTVLRAVGNGDNFVADSYNPETRTITRRIGVKVFNGTESFVKPLNGYAYQIYSALGQSSGVGYCSHFKTTPASGEYVEFGVSGNKYVYFRGTDSRFPTVTDLQQYLANQYAAGTPVTVYYPLKTPTEERIQ